MPLVVAEYGAFQIVVKYLHQKQKGGVWYFRRRIPEDVQRHYPNLNKAGVMFVSLKTKNQSEAAQKANQMALEQEALWKNLRSGELETTKDVDAAAIALLDSFGFAPYQGDRLDTENAHYGRFLDELHFQAGTHPDAVDSNWQDQLPMVHHRAAELLHNNSKPPLLLSEALTEYQSIKGENPQSRQGKTRAKVVNDFASLFGDLPITRYTRQNANDFRDHLLAKGNTTSTVQRRLNDIRPVFRTVAREHELEDKGIFEAILIAGLGKDVTARVPFTTKEILAIQSACREIDDDKRWLVALLGESGLRLAEAVGLRTEDVFLNCEYPYIKVVEHDVRSLKTKGSNRTVPLVGAGRWAVERAIKHQKNGFLFPKYINFSTNPFKHNADSASATLNKWLIRLSPKDGGKKTMHSFRHSVQDRLRDSGAPEELRNAICGWKNAGVGASYGEGFSMERKTICLSKIVLETEVNSLDEAGSQPTKR